MSKTKAETDLPHDRTAFGINELARSWGTSRDTVVRLIADGELESIKARSRVLIPRASVERFLQERR